MTHRNFPGIHPNFLKINVIKLKHALLLFSCPTVSDSLGPPWTAALQASPSPRVCPSSCLFHWLCRPTISSTDTLFLCPQSFSASGTFPMFTSDDQNTGASASASVLLMSIQGLFPLRLTGLISLLSKGLSGTLSSTTI